MKLNWGVKITILYSSFVVMMITLVVASTHQKFELVSDDYYKQELSYQDVIDATRNQASLSSSVRLDATGNFIEISFPQEFDGREIAGTVQFYSPIKADYDKQWPIAATGNKMLVEKRLLSKTAYKVKISYTVDQKDYYQESELNLIRYE